jgi:hypothetical protein
MMFMFKYSYRFLRKGTNKLSDPISLENFDLLGEWVGEEPGVLNDEDLDWDTVDGPSASVNLDYEELSSADGEIVVYDENPSFMTTPQRFDTYNIVYD